jgi:predicted alpha/beta superfamily hydrolase
MKQLFILFMFISTVSLGQSVESIKINSGVLNQERELLVYTPLDYEENKDIKYDLVFVFDSQHRELFDYTHASLSFLNNSKSKFIVVGVTSPYIESLDYSRNNDMLTKPTTKRDIERFGNYAGNADSFMLYIQNEAIPYIEKNFRVTTNRLAVGHSNSAFFVLHSFLNNATLFDGYLCISPNFSYNDEELLKRFNRFDFEGLEKQKFLYLSNASEEKSKNWEIWKPTRINAYSFFQNKSKETNKVSLVIDEFPEENHWSTFAPALTKGLKVYFAYKEKVANQYSEETYPVYITVAVPNKDDIVYITGNQPELGNWNPSVIKMTKKSDYVREINLNLHNPAQFKFTKGSWTTEGEINTLENGANVKIDLSQSKAFHYTIHQWGTN